MSVVKSDLSLVETSAWLCYTWMRTATATATSTTGATYFSVVGGLAIDDPDVSDIEGSVAAERA